MAYGLVLEGGGAKGSYQLGSYLAILEGGFPIDAVVGASIGALNGAFIAQGNWQDAMDLWKTRSLEIEDDRFIAHLKKVSSKSFSPPKALEVMKHLGTLSNEPLQKMIDEFIDEEKLRASSMDFGLVIYNLRHRRAEELFLEDIPKGELKKYLMASCAYPGFPPVRIGKEVYMDGGLGNNIPYEMVVKRGLDPLILRTNPMKKKSEVPENALVVAPMHPVANTLDFDSDRAALLIQKGYWDGIRTVCGYKGDEYHFYPPGEVKAAQLILTLFLSKSKTLQYMISSENLSTERVILEKLIPKLAGKLGLQEDFTYEDFLVALLEYRGNLVGISKDRVYSVEEFISLAEKPVPMVHREDREERLLMRVQHLIFTPKPAEERHGS